MKLPRITQASHTQLSLKGTLKTVRVTDKAPAAKRPMCEVVQPFEASSNASIQPSCASTAREAVRSVPSHPSHLWENFLYAL